MCCILSVPAWNMACCLPALLSLWRLDQGQRRQRQWQRGGGSCGDNDGSGGNTILQLRLQPNEHRCGPELPVWKCMPYGMTTGNEVYSAAKVLGGGRVCHYQLELPCHMWLNPGVFDLGVSQPVCGLVRGLRPRHPVPVACKLRHPHCHWPRGPHPHVLTGPCHCALRPWHWVL